MWNHRDKKSDEISLIEAGSNISDFRPSERWVWSLWLWIRKGWLSAISLPSHTRNPVALLHWNRGLPCKDAASFANSNCNHGDAQGGEVVQSVTMTTHRHWTPTPHFILIPSYTGDPAAGQHRSMPSWAKNTGLLLRG